MENFSQKLRDEIRKLSPEEGNHKTHIPFVQTCLFTSKTIQMPISENPYLYMILDGSLRLHTPSGIMDYAEGQHSVSQIDTPLFGTVLTVSERNDFLAVSVEFTASDVISVVLDLENSLIEKITDEREENGVEPTADNKVSESVYRLFSSATRSAPSEFIRKNIMREVIYYLLCSSCGKQLLQSITNLGNSRDIYEANSWIKENFRNSFTVERLAEERNMSVPLFHQKFKHAVGMAPLQCPKRLRLTEARKLMLEEDRNVTEASFDVGYESLSQFIRDYKKIFGKSPKEDILNIKNHLKK